MERDEANHLEEFFIGLNGQRFLESWIMKNFTIQKGIEFTHCFEDFKGI